MLRVGFFEKYFINPYFRQWKDFSGKQPREEFALSLAAWGIVTIGLAGLLLGLVGLLGPQVGFVTLGVVGALWIGASVVPIAALRRRCSASESDREVYRRAPMLGIDMLMTVVCGLFFLFGLLMMITTLNSGELNMNPRGTGQSGDNPILMRDSVIEEPIFNYFTETSPAEGDDMDDLADKDTLSLDESFDPTVNTDANVEADTLGILN